MIGNFYVGQKPLGAFSIQVVDNDGVEVNLSAYTDISVIMIDPQNKEVDITGSELLVSQGVGKLAFRLPMDRSLFTHAGEYLLQLRLRNDLVGADDYTSEYTIQVQKFGGRD